MLSLQILTNQTILESKQKREITKTKSVYREEQRIWLMVPVLCLLYNNMC